MLEARLLRMANRFWKPAGQLAHQLPRDIESAIAWSLPLFIVRVPHLCVHDVNDYLGQRQLPSLISAPDRPLHGCVLASRGKGLLMVDGSDDARELRFTLAHEV